ncbi:MAG: pyridoxamine 5'-phosphate oxidase family protein [Spirochaetaceae bacterium]|jgi:nitroimidazol reductase NimA-like FMN-containing flavoprotein (pyridoxamine 5'-phosphate oxidase superfamily)|nr:pyridoxamine 5'-phosphate oxidase family protein [Spirochaetaceae bacterium]
MPYQMRRKDRELSQDDALAVLDRAPYGVLSTLDKNGGPYCIPLSLVREGQWLYFHCARTGHKIDNLRTLGQVCAAFVGRTEFPEDDFTVHYESAVVFGRAEEITGDEEKIHCLRLICERFTPKNMAAFDAEIAKMLKATGVWKIRIESITGKRREKM